MSKELQIFENPEFGKVRVVEKDGQPWFVGKDVAEILGYTNGSRDINRHVDEEDRQVIQNYQNGTLEIPNRGMIIINESGLYSLILSSKLPTARRFKRWVTSEVLPQIRQTGGYIPFKEEETEQEIMAKALLIAHKTLELKDKQIEEMKPKVQYVDLILSNKSLLTITQIAKDYGKSGTALNNLLHDLGIQYKQSGQWLLYQKFQDKGYVHSETITFNSKEGQSFTKLVTKWTQKGRLFLYNFLKEHGILPIIEKE